MRAMALAASALTFACLSLPGGAALAQSSDEGFDKRPDDAIKAQRQADDEKKTGKIPGQKDKPAAEAPKTDDHDPKELDGKAYRFIGLRVRDVFVPQFMIDLFASGGTNVNVGMIGPEFGIRKDHSEIDFSFQYADYGMSPTLLKGKSDQPDSYQLVSSTMKILYLSVDLLYDIPVIDDTGRFSFLIGGGVGIGGVLGNLNRAYAYPLSPGNADAHDLTPGNWTACAGNPQQGSMLARNSPPAPTAPYPYCTSVKQVNGMYEYGNYQEPGWTNGGSLPVVFPWLSIPQLSFRYKPIKELQTRADVGFSLTGFFFGLSAGYGL
jgi:hypothetical protein